MKNEDPIKPMTSSMKTLRLIKRKLDELMSLRDTKHEIRATDLYDFIAKDSVLKKEFPTQRSFNYFLKKQYNHPDNLFKQFIPNSEVDTSNKDFYQWKFFKGSQKTQNTKGLKTESLNSNSMHYRDERTVEVSDGTFVRSDQEKVIYEALLEKDFLEINYEETVSKFGERKEVDFKIKNKMTQKEFLWEHFGMTNDDSYRDKMTDKIEWYKNNGLQTVEKKGNLIFTIWENENKFNKDIQKYLDSIINS